MTEVVVDGPGHPAGVPVLATPSPLLAAEMVESAATRDPAEPGTRGPAARVEPAPGAERPLKGLAREVFGDCPVARQEQQVAVHGVELRLRDGREARSVDMQAGPRRRHRVHGPHT